MRLNPKAQTYGSGFGVWGVGFRVSGLGFKDINIHISCPESQARPRRCPNSQEAAAAAGQEGSGGSFVLCREEGFRV